ncbi:MAG: ferritin-like domain-containing protein [Calothrix sp. MO_167.B12]|nr:ferritin-like domain-containing protein [Calothrix sp. MO_167.B12]
MSTSTNVSVKNDFLWDITHLQEHLRYAADLEFWTIPFYVSAFWSLACKLTTPANLYNDFTTDKLTDQAKLILSVAIEEMFHFQTACNIANAFNAFDGIDESKLFPLPVYGQKDSEGYYKFPHIDFNLLNLELEDNPTKHPIKYPPIVGETYDFTQYTSELGAADPQHIHAMCLIEYPNWLPEEAQELKQNVKDYSSIGHFYNAILIQLDVKGSYFNGYCKADNQVIQGTKKKEFSNQTDFQNMKPKEVILNDKEENLSKVKELIGIITTQGEGRQVGNEKIPSEYQNIGHYQYQNNQQWPHFEKFLQLYNHPPKPEQVSQPTQKPISDHIQDALAKFREGLIGIFVKHNGQDVDGQKKLMTNLSKAIYDCYPHQ